jgi:hypothetical protein
VKTLPRPKLASITCAALAIGSVVFRRKQLRWGATEAEVALKMPGDEILSIPSLTATRGITIECGSDEVWPWIAQLGQGRGGFYSYDVLENVARCDIHSAEHVVPEWQSVSVGDQVRLAPEMPLEVVVADRARALVLQGGVPMGSAGPPYDFTWAFVLIPQSEGSTRLVVRERYLYKKSWTPLLVEPVEVISFVMTQKMLRGIRDRAERTAGAPSFTS